MCNKPWEILQGTGRLSLSCEPLTYSLRKGVGPGPELLSGITTQTTENQSLTTTFPIIHRAKHYRLLVSRSK